MCLEQNENRRIIAFLGDIVAFFLSLTVTLASVAMLLSQLNAIFQTTESLFHYLGRLFTAVLVSDHRFGFVSSAYIQLL